MEKKMRTARILLALLLAASMTLGAVGCQSNGGTEETGTSSVSETETVPSREEEEDPSGTMQGFLCVAGPLEGAENAVVTSADEAVTVTADYVKAHGYRNAWKHLRAAGTTVFGDVTYYRIDQYYNDMPVLDRGFVLAAGADGRVLGLTGNAVDTRGIIHMPEDTPEAERAAILTLLSETYDPNLLYMVETDLPTLVLAADEAAQRYTVCGRMTVYIDGVPTRVLYDAVGGKLYSLASLRYADTAEITGKDQDGNDVTFTATATEDGYIMTDPARRLSVFDADNKVVTVTIERRDDGSYAPVISTAGSGVIGGGDTVLSPVVGKTVGWDNASAVTAMYRMERLMTFFDTTFGRAAFDGADGAVSLIFEDGATGNLFGNTWTYAADGQAVISLGAEGLLVPTSKKNLAPDVLGHEYMHAVAASACGLVGGGETAVIAEAYADLFGEFFEDWLADSALDNTCDWIHGVPARKDKYEQSRSLFDPNSTGNPVYNGQDTMTDEQEAAWGISENEPHHLSTVLTHAAYDTMTENFTTAGLARLWYRALLMLPADASFTDLRRTLELTAAMMELPEDVRTAQSAAFDRAGVYGYAYAQELDVEVFDSAEHPYAAYEAEITQSGEPVELLTGVEPTFHVSLEPGNYTLTLKDTLNEGSTRTMILRIGDGSVPTSSLLRLYFVTDTRSSLESVLDGLTVAGELPSLEEMTEPVGIRAMDNVLPLPKELILMSEGQTDDGRVWRRYGFVETDMVTSKVVRTILYVGAGIDAPESVYLLFSRADGQPLGGNYDEIYRKCTLSKSLTGWVLNYRGGSIPTLIENASNSGSGFSYTESEANPEDFLYFDASANRPLTSTEWREVIHFSERFALNDDATLPQSAAEAVAAGFQKLSKGDSKYHQFDASLDEWAFGACLKFVRQDGKEAVYLIVNESGSEETALTDPKATRLLPLGDFPEIGPTFNYALNAFDTENFITNLLDKAASASIAHYYFDMIPYYWWGNHPDQIDHVHTIVFDEGVPATCSENGISRGMHCSECGKVIEAPHEVLNLGHDFVDGVCTRCGAADPAIGAETETSSGPSGDEEPIIIE